MTQKKEDLAKIVGEENVLDTPNELENFSKDESIVHQIKPRYILRPKNADQVQKIVKWANTTLTSLVPVSSGFPHFRGDTVPSIGGSIIVDLSGMNKILRIDAEHRVAMIEPGVTFSELMPELARNGLRPNLPLLPRSSKSVVGSLLEREPVIMPRYHWDISDPIACSEVIYGTGDLFRTGSAAGPGTLEEQWEADSSQNEAAGPVQADFYRLIQGAQGTMGIVTWATFRCERLPSLEEPFLLCSSRLEDILEFCHWVIRLRLVDECIVLNNTNLANIFNNEWFGEREVLKDFFPSWVLFFSIGGYRYFPEEKVNYQINAMEDIAKSLKLEPLRAIGGASAFELLKILHKPSEEPHWKLRNKGSCYDIFFLASAEKLTELVSVMNGVAEDYIYSISDMGIYIQPIVQGVCYHCEFNLFFDPDNLIEREKIHRLSIKAVEDLANRGAFFSRPYGAWADMAYRRDAQTTLALRKIKEIYDPNNIMNTGKLCFEC